MVTLHVINSDTLCSHSTQAPSNMIDLSETVVSASTGVASASDFVGSGLTAVQQAVLVLFKQIPVSAEVRESNLQFLKYTTTTIMV